LDRLLDSGLLCLVIDPMGVDDPGIREISYICALNIAPFNDRYCQIWIDKEGLLEHLVDNVSYESFNERVTIVRLFGNLFWRSILSEELRARIDFIDAFVPILKTRQNELLDIIIRFSMN
jgi:hypothetical protein